MAKCTYDTVFEFGKTRVRMVDGDSQNGLYSKAIGCEGVVKSKEGDLLKIKWDHYDHVSLDNQEFRSGMFVWRFEIIDPVIWPECHYPHVVWECTPGNDVYLQWSWKQLEKLGMPKEDVDAVWNEWAMHPGTG